MIAKNNSTHFLLWLAEVDNVYNIEFCKTGIITEVHSDEIRFISSISKKIQPLFFKLFHPCSPWKTSNFFPVYAKFPKKTIFPT